MAEDEDLAEALAMSMEQDNDTTGLPCEAAAADLRKVESSTLAENNTKSILHTLLSNLVRNPSEDKYRKVKLSNAKISKAISPPGAETMLFAAGYVKLADMLEIPSGTAADTVVSSAQTALDALDTVGEFHLAAQLRADGPVRSVCALDGGGLATGAMDNLVRVYQANAWETPKILRGHEQRAGVSGVLALNAEVDNVDFVSAGRDGKIICWQDGAIRATLTGHGEGIEGTNAHVVSCLAARSDGTLVSGGWDKTVRVWDGGDESLKLAAHSVAVNSVVGLPSGEIASGSGDQSIAIWRGESLLRTLKAPTPVRALASCGGPLLASGGNDGVLRLWHIECPQQFSEMPLGDSYIYSLAYCAVTGELAVGTDVGAVYIVSLSNTTMKVVCTLQHMGEVYGVACLRNGDIAAACGNGTCAVWTRCVARQAPQAIREDYQNGLRAWQAASPASIIAPTSASGSWDCNFPVDLGSRKMNIHWNRGEEVQVIVDRFLSENGLDAQHKGDITGFVMHAQQQAMNSTGVSAGSSSFDFSYPVEVADGRRLMINWNRGDDPHQVAVAFARINGMIGADELPSIMSFIKQVSGTASVSTYEVAPALTAQQEQSMLMQVMEMGFDEATARDALQAVNWSVESAVARLLG